jgi:hypothetical protein
LQLFFENIDTSDTQTWNISSFNFDVGEFMQKLASYKTTRQAIQISTRVSAVPVSDGDIGGLLGIHTQFAMPD